MCSTIAALVVDKHLANSCVVVLCGLRQWASMADTHLDCVAEIALRQACEAIKPSKECERRMRLMGQSVMSALKVSLLDL